MDIMMPLLEKNILKNEYTNANCILEFGSGGSTLFASSLNKKTFSVESDKNWADYISKNINSETTKIHYVNIGPTKRFGYPKNQDKKFNWQNYSLSVWDRNDFVHPDIILIDGRFRVSCFLVASTKIKRKTKILFDDFDRKEYQIIQKYFDIKEKIGRLAIFEVEPNISIDYSIIERYFYKTK